LEAIAPHVCREALALEDVTAGQPDFPLDIWGTEHFGIDDGVRDVAAEGAEGRQRELFGGFTTIIPGSFSEAIGNVLGEHAHGVRSFGGDAPVMDALKVEFGPEFVR
jgi:hypothetical protein